MRLSLHMMVLNAASTLERVLRPLEGIADEVCVTDTGSSDGTFELTEELCSRYKIRHSGVHFSWLTSPSRYFIDEQATFKFRFPDQSVNRFSQDFLKSAIGRRLETCRYVSPDEQE